jgi:hypothetical protein
MEGEEEKEERNCSAEKSKVFASTTRAACIVSAGRTMADSLVLVDGSLTELS